MQAGAGHAVQLGNAHLSSSPHRNQAELRTEQVLASDEESKGHNYCIKSQTFQPLYG